MLGNAQEACCRVGLRAVLFLFPLTLSSLISSRLNALRATELKLANTAGLFLMSIMGGTELSLD